MGNINNCSINCSVCRFNNKENEDETTLAYTELIKQISEKNIAKVEMTTGSTSIKVTLGQEIKEGKIVEDGIKFDKEKEELSEEEKKALEKNAIVPNIQSFIELIQEQVAN